MLARRTLLAFGLLAASSAAASAIDLQWPVACRVGETCAIQNYVDRDPGPGVRDYRCGAMSYDGHNGVDIRLLTLKAQHDGVNVLAAAAGRVLRVRDDAEDGEAQRVGRAGVKGRECGNGLVLAHADGWETQYCHMALGSLVVRAGETVSAGQALGRIGMSGDTEFPHLHLTLRRRGQVVDPFAVNPADASCGGAAEAWAPALREGLAYRAGAVLNAGFTTGPVTMAEIDDGAGLVSLAADAPALVAFTRAIGLRRGDVQRLAVTAPDGRVLVDRTAPALDTDKAQVLLFAGIKRPAAGWEPGEYRAAYSVTRDRSGVIERVFNFTR